MQIVVIKRQSFIIIQLDNVLVERQNKFIQISDSFYAVIINVSMHAYGIH